MGTIAAIATPPGRGGVGIIRVSGPKAHEIAMQLRRSPRPMTPRLATYARWFDASGEVLDRGIMIYFPSPNSYTGEDVLELHAHGNPLLLQRLLRRVFELGARPALPGEFTRRAVESGKLDLTQAEAVALCINAETERAAKQAQRLLSGELGLALQRLMDKLTKALAAIEATLDFPEEDIPTEVLENAREIVLGVSKKIGTMLNGADLGTRLFAGAKIAVIGAPNVGKSSLLNRLCGLNRMIVSDTPGTTRDTVELDFDVHGIPIKLVDTAGIRDTKDEIEKEGVRRAIQAAELADITLFVADATRAETWQPEMNVHIRVMNKVDLVGDLKVPEPYLPISAKTGYGIDRLLDRIASHLGERPDLGEGLLIVKERHLHALTEAERNLREGLDHLGMGALDLAALAWRKAWAALGSVLGVGDVEDLLDCIFREFCIGK